MDDYEKLSSLIRTEADGVGQGCNPEEFGAVVAPSFASWACGRFDQPEG